MKNDTLPSLLCQMDLHFDPVSAYCIKKPKKRGILDNKPSTKIKSFLSSRLEKKSQCKNLPQKWIVVTLEGSKFEGKKHSSFPNCFAQTLVGKGLLLFSGINYLVFISIFLLLLSYKLTTFSFFQKIFIIRVTLASLIAVKL